jgi:YesN/AraC family two-component response regulator
MTQIIARKKLAIVLYDEHESLQTFGFLKKALFDVHAFSDGASAYEHFRYDPNEFAVVISDIKMPGMSGFELVREAKKLNPDVKVILLTPFKINQAEFSRVLPSTHVDAFLQKPFAPAEMSEILQTLLKGKNAE